MTTIFLASLLLVGLAFVLLGIRVFFCRGGKFPQTHVGSNKAMQDRGIGCHTAQHFEAQHHRNLEDRIKKLE